MPWKPEYAERRRERYKTDARERDRRKSQGRTSAENVEYMRQYRSVKPDKFKRSPEQQAEINRKRRERYAADAAYRDECKRSSKQRSSAARREGRLKATYGFGSAEYDAMLAKQGGRCAICRCESDKHLHVDHCHSSGAVRGLLCSSCNTGLGHFRDDAERLNRAVVYLVQSK
nr:hypothetical protein [Sphingobium sp.]